MSFYLEETCNIPFDFAYAKLAEDVIAFCLSHENFPYEAEVNLTLTDNEEIHRINLEYRQIDRPTDVLSFPMLSYEKAGDFSFLEEESEEDINQDTGEVMLGYGHSPKREFAFLIVHSMLHLFGYDHIDPKDAAIMEPKQKQILEEMHIVRD